MAEKSLPGSQTFSYSELYDTGICHSLDDLPPITRSKEAVVAQGHEARAVSTIHPLQEFITFIFDQSGA
jgi:hypothetical protein